MKHTREQLDGMSDFEVNKLLATLHPDIELVGTGEYPLISESAVHVRQRLNKHIEEFGADYCDEWDRIMPLAVEYKISITYPEIGSGCFVGSSGDFMFYTCKEQRAKSCCLIMLLESKND